MLKVIGHKDARWTWEMNGQHSENFNKETENIKKCQTSYNWTEKYTRGIQQQIGWSRGMNQWAGKQSNGTHPDRAAKWKQNLK